MTGDHKTFFAKEEKEITSNTKVTVGLVVSVCTAIASYVWAMASLPSKDYVDKQIQLVRQEVSKSDEDMRYIRSQIDDIKRILIERK